MPIIVINTLIILLAIVFQSSFINAFHFQAFCIHFPLMAAAVAASLNAPISPFVISMFIIAAFADSLVSGPPGLYLLLALLLALALLAFINKFRPQRVFILSLLVAFASAIFDLANGLVLALSYPDARILNMIPSQMWINALATSLSTPLLYVVVKKANALWQKRNQSGYRI